MRYSICLFLMLGLGLITLASNKSHAIDVKEINKSEIYQPIVDAINDRFDQQVEMDGAASNENTTGRAAAQEISGRRADAVQAVATARAHQVSDVNTYKRTGNMDPAFCVLASPAQSVYEAQQSAKKSAKEKLNRRLETIAGAPGTICENGAVDCKNKLYAQMITMPSTRLSFGNLLMTDNIEQTGATQQQLEYIQNLLYARAPVYLNQDLVDNADTETKNALIEADRLRAEMSIGQTVFSMLEGAKSPNPDSNRGVQFLREHLEVNGAKPEMLDDILPNDASYRAQLEALTVGMFGTGTMMQSFVDTPENRTIGIMFQLMLNNVMALEQLKYLEAIAAATSTQVIATREEAIKDVNARISRKNARN